MRFKFKVILNLNFNEIFSEDVYVLTRKLVLYFQNGQMAILFQS